MNFTSVYDIGDILQAVSAERIRRDVFYLAHDPLPCRTLNYVVTGHEKCTLYEADDFITQVLRSGGYHIESEAVRVQPFVADPSAAWGFRKPIPGEPSYDAVNILASKPGTSGSSETLLILAHKDSKSWLDCAPGAYDNAVGVAALLEISRVIRRLELRRNLMLLFCNEEHWPWTSVEAATRIARSDLEIVGVLNVDSIGGKSGTDRADGRLTSVVRYSTPEGNRVADLIGAINEGLGIGLEHRKVFVERPNDDDGSFIEAGILPAVLMIGSYPYADPNYHTPADTPDKVDIENVKRATQLIVATVLKLCL